MVQHQSANVNANNASNGNPSNNGPLVIDTQHEDMVHDSQLNYYGTTLATASSDRTVKIYEVGATYQHTGTISGHQGPVWEVAWSHPKFGTLLASCSFDGTAMIHRESQPRNWTKIHHYQSSASASSSINSVQFSPHEFGLNLACASSSGTVAVLTHQADDSWSTATFTDNGLGTNSLSWAPYTNEGTEPTLRLVTGGCDNRIRFWAKNRETGAWEEEGTLGEGAGHGDWVRDVAWAPSTSPGLDTVASCGEDGLVIIWTRRAGESVWNPFQLHSFGGPVWRVSWSVTGNILAVSSGDSDVSLWKQTLDGNWQHISDVADTGGVVPGES